MPFESAALTRRRVAVIGAGISGMGAAHALSQTQHVTLFEAEPRLGGHARTIMAGLRVATVSGIGIATIAALIGAGGLGEFIFRGIQSVNTGLLLIGAVPAALMALAADFGLGLIEKRLVRGQAA